MNNNLRISFTKETIKQSLLLFVTYIKIVPGSAVLFTITVIYLENSGYFGRRRQLNHFNQHATRSSSTALYESGKEGLDIPVNDGISSLLQSCGFYNHRTALGTQLLIGH